MDTIDRLLLGFVLVCLIVSILILTNSTVENRKAICEIEPTLEICDDN